MITFMSPDSRTDVWLLPLVICDKLSKAHKYTLRRKDREDKSKHIPRRGRWAKLQQRERMKRRRRGWQTEERRATNEVTVTWLWQHGAIISFWQWGQCGLSRALGEVESITENDSYCITLIWRVINNPPSPTPGDEVTKPRPSQQTNFTSSTLD